MKPFARALTAAVADATVSDRELLARFAEAGDGAAFELLVRRHADLVWRVCRGELPNDRHAAEDAFQATFLVLARKASAVREPSAAGFLFRVARHAAVRTRKRVGTVAEAVAQVPADPTADPVCAGEASAAVVAEVANLPDKFRLPVLLCFFDDCTHAEAADRLGWAVGTVASRLARAKDRLRDRLTRKGFALPAVLAGAASAEGVRAAVAAATTPSAVPAGVSELSREVLNAMWSWKTKLVGGGLLAVLLVGGVGLSMLAAKPAPDAPKAKEQPKAKPPERERPEDDELKKLQGVWRVTRLESKLGVAPANEIEPMRWEFIGDVVVAQDRPDAEKQRTRIALDAANTPRHITMEVLDGPKPEVGKKLTGIYELKGDKLRLCLAFPGADRPTEFKKPDDGQGGLIELARVPVEPKGKERPEVGAVPPTKFPKIVADAKAFAGNAVPHPAIPAEKAGEGEVVALARLELTELLKALSAVTRRLAVAGYSDADTAVALSLGKQITDAIELFPWANDADRLAWYEHRILWAKGLEEVVRLRVKSGEAAPSALPLVSAARLRAEIVYIKARPAAK